MLLFLPPGRRSFELTMALMATINLEAYLYLVWLARFEGCKNANPDRAAD